jgi:hypothetical protein
MKLRTPLILVALACGVAFGTGVTPGCGSSNGSGGGGGSNGGNGQGGTPGTGGTTTPGTGGTTSTTTPTGTGGTTSTSSTTPGTGGGGGAGGGAPACDGSGPHDCTTCGDILLNGKDPSSACPGSAAKVAAVETCVCDPNKGCAMAGGACHDSCTNMTAPDQACQSCGETQCASDPSVAACLNDNGMGQGANPCSP